MDYSGIPRDTTLEAAQIQVKVLQGLGTEGRGRMAAELSENLRINLEHGVRKRHPEYDDDAVYWAVTRLLVGNELFRQFFPDIHISP